MDVRGPRGGYPQYYPWEINTQHRMIRFSKSLLLLKASEPLRRQIVVVSFYLEFPLLICVTISAGHHISLWARDSGDTDMILVMCQGVAEITRGYIF